MCHACREHVNTDENLIYARLCLSPWEVGEQLERGVTPAGSILGRIRPQLHLTANCLRGYLGLCLQTPTELQTSTVKHWVGLIPSSSSTGFHHVTVLVSWVLLPKGPRQKQRWVSFHYKAPPPSRLTHHHLHPNLLPPHLLPSSERCISLLIFLRLAKAG